MSKRKMDAVRQLKTFNKGYWLSAKIYSDSKNACACGGKFDGLKVECGISLPVCSACLAYPLFLRIRAKVLDIHGTAKYLDIRYTKNGDRITKPYECMTILDRVNDDIKQGCFDVRDYESKKSREGFLLKNYTKSYLEYNQKRLQRGEITPNGYKHKVKYCKIVVQYFGETEINRINGPMIDRFKNSFTEKFTNRDQGLTELKTILNHAVKMGDLTASPKFEYIPSSNKRESVLEISEARRIIPYIENDMYRVMITILSEYAVRPCEIRALQFRDISFSKNTVTFSRHFSLTKLIEGRKSRKTGKNASISFPLIGVLREYLNALPIPLDTTAYVFQGKTGGAVNENTLPKAWARTLQKLGLPHVQMYELRHARGTEVLEMSNGNIIATKEFLGHSNIQTTINRYARPEVDKCQFFALES